MSDNELKRKVQQWAAKAGAHKVKAILIERQLSSSLVEKVVSGRYQSGLRGASKEIIESELQKAGFITRTKAS